LDRDWLLTVGFAVTILPAGILTVRYVKPLDAERARTLAAEGKAAGYLRATIVAAVAWGLSLFFWALAELPVLIRGGEPTSGGVRTLGWFRYSGKIAMGLVLLLAICSCVSAARLIGKTGGVSANPK